MAARAERGGELEILVAQASQRAVPGASLFQLRPFSRSELAVQLGAQELFKTLGVHRCAFLRLSLSHWRWSAIKARSSDRARLMRDFTVPKETSKVSAISS